MIRILIRILFFYSVIIVVFPPPFILEAVRQGTTNDFYGTFRIQCPQRFERGVTTAALRGTALSAGKNKSISSNNSSGSNMDGSGGYFGLVLPVLQNSSGMFNIQ